MDAPLFAILKANGTLLRNRLPSAARSDDLVAQRVQVAMSRGRLGPRHPDLRRSEASNLFSSLTISQRDIIRGDGVASSLRVRAAEEPSALVALLSEYTSRKVDERHSENLVETHF